ncbi:MAG: hypothetical protein WC867_04875 [Candidatus Pacearchaeota archaeon]|jgi:RNase P subunit RPR2
MKNPKNLSKSEIQERISKTFSSNPSKEDIRKIRNLAMSKNVKIKEHKKKFCKKCFTLFNSSNSQIRIKNSLKIIHCLKCGYISRYKLK